MSTAKETVDYILDQLAPLPVRAKAMFGEYGVYCDEKFVALICNDTLFVKPTAISHQFFSDADLAPPYPGAKDHYAVPGARLEDHTWLQEVFAHDRAGAGPEAKNEEKGWLDAVIASQHRREFRPRPRPHRRRWRSLPVPGRL